MDTENVISSLLNFIYAAFDRGEFAVTLFLDLTKAFDLLDKRILLRKLRMYRIMYMYMYMYRIMLMR